MKRLQKRLLFGLLLGVAVFVALGLYADFAAMGRLLTAFDWRWLPAILGLTGANYALRFAKWHFYMRRIGLAELPVRDDLLIYLGGFGLTLTPGKAGELVRLLWLQHRTGAHPAVTAPAAAAERLTDGLAMALLSLAGGAMYPSFRAAALLIGGGLAAMVAVVQIRPLSLALLSLAERLPLLSRGAHRLHALYESAYELFRWRNLLLAVGLGGVAWFCEGVALYLVLRGLGEPASWGLALLSVFALSSASAAGGASGLPGGVGVTEGGLTGVLQLLAGLSQNVAATATLMIRFLILWLGVVGGLLIIVRWRAFLFGETAQA